MPEPITSSVSIERGQGLMALRSEAVKSAILQSALEQVNKHGSADGAADAAWGLHFDLSWMPADPSEIAMTAPQVGGG